MPLIEHALKPLAKSILIALGLTAAVSGTDPAIQKKIHGSGTATLIISNEEENDFMKKVSLLKIPVY